jgi:hypothetical protein
MKRLIVILVVTVFVFGCKNEPKTPMGKLNRAYCECLDDTKGLPDSVRVDSCDIRVLADTLSMIKTDSAAEVLLNDLHIYLQKNCKNYVSLLDRLDKDENWKRIDKKEKTRLTDIQCQEFIKYRELYYIEPTLDTTYVTIENGFWTERLKRGQYVSKSSFRWTTGCDFELVFIESNDPVKGKLSKKGDKYTYRILDKKDTYFLLLGTVKKVSLQFKVFF